MKLTAVFTFMDESVSLVELGNPTFEQRRVLAFPA